ncbi:MAG TPA: HEAT repeat domain-containing protein, partial [Aggregatilineaceae bacterium]|nr:HEAT repeat domain-containing protein [Aggregatilineaceae bacterium]
MVAWKDSAGHPIGHQSATLGHADPAAIQALMDILCDRNTLKRHRARLLLVDIGLPAVPFLVQALEDPDAEECARWEAAKALSDIGDPMAAPALIDVLGQDEQFGIRWLAAEGLIALGRNGLVPLLNALIQRSNSAWLREGAHHVLRTLAGRGLYAQVAPVLTALED